METHSDKLIQKKIDTVNSLPEGYSPNLNNKWEILAAGLATKKKPIFLYFNKISVIAAMLLMIGGVSFFLIKTIKRNEAIKPIVSLPMPIEKEKLVSKSNELEHPKLVVKNNRIPTEDKRIEKQIEIIQSESIKKDSFILLEKPAIILTAAIPKKTKRFTEIDFNEPIIQEKITTTNMAFNQRFSFKIGSSLQNNAGNSSHAQANTFGLTKQFN